MAAKDFQKIKNNIKTYYQQNINNRKIQTTDKKK